MTICDRIREKLELHLDLAVTGEELRARLNPEALTGWAEGKPVMPVGAWRGVVAMLAIAAAAALSYYFLTSVYWPFLLALILETTVIRQLRRRAQAVIGEISCNAEGLELFSQMLRRLEGEAFVSSRLHGFAARLQSPPRCAAPRRIVTTSRPPAPAPYWRSRGSETVRGRD